MRSSLVLCGSALLFAGACSGGSSGPICPAGYEYCNGVCITMGACATTSTGGDTGIGGGAPATGGDTGVGGGDGSGGVVPATGGSGPVEVCADTASLAGDLNGQYGTINLATDQGGKSYRLHSNWFNDYNGQTLSFNGLSFTIGNPNNASTTSSAPLGYPSFFIGSYSGNSSAGSNLPKQVSELTTIPTVFRTNATSLDMRAYNAAYDVWFTSSSSPLGTNDFSPGSGGAYLMVWLFDPSEEQPRGSNQRPGQTVSGVSGTWDVWWDNTNPRCISYVATSAINSLDFDLNNFIQHAVNNSYGITSSMYLSVIFAGFEVWRGGNGLSVDQFCAHVN